MARRRKNATFTLDQTYGAGRADRSFITAFYAALDKAYPGSKQIPIPPLKNIHPTRPPIEQAIIFADCVRSVLAPLVVTALGYAELAQELEDLPMLDADEVMAKCRLSPSQRESLRKETIQQVAAIYKKYDPARARRALGYSPKMLDEAESDHARVRAEFDDAVELLRSAQVGYFEPDRVRKIELLTEQAEVLDKKVEQLHTKLQELVALRETYLFDPKAVNLTAYAILDSKAGGNMFSELFRLISNLIIKEDPYNASVPLSVDYTDLSASMVEVVALATGNTSNVRYAAKVDAEATWDVVNQTLEQL